MFMKRHCLTLDLKDDPELIKEYEDHHKNVWPEIIKSIKDAGIESMQIYRLGNRMFMIMEVTDEFNFEVKALADKENPLVQQWETLMWKFQEALPMAKPGEKWLLMDKIFEC